MREGKNINHSAVVLPIKRALNRPLLPRGKKQKRHEVQQTPPLSPPPQFDVLNSQESLVSMWSPSCFVEEQHPNSFSQVSLPSSQASSPAVPSLTADEQVLTTMCTLRSTIAEARQTAKEQLEPLLDKDICWRVSVIRRKLRVALEQVKKIEIGNMLYRSK